MYVDAITVQTRKTLPDTTKGSNINFETIYFFRKYNRLMTAYI